MLALVDDDVVRLRALVAEGLRERTRLAAALAEVLEEVDALRARLDEVEETAALTLEVSAQVLAGCGVDAFTVRRVARVS